MANIQSAIKRNRQNTKRRARNRVTRGRMRTFSKRADELIVAGDKEGASEAVYVAVRAIDKAAQKGVIHRSNADRHKSRLMRRFNAM